MISFACPACGKQLKVKDELAGKKGKCPGCGKPVGIPAASENLAAALSEPGRVSPPPVVQSSGEDERTLPPKAPPVPAKDPMEPPTLTSAGPGGIAVRADSSGQQTMGGAKAGGEHPPELTDFLAPAQAPDEIGRLGPYRVLAILGYGGMGVVFRAEDPGLERNVALKAMLPALASNAANRARFLREAKAAAAVKDDHVVAIFQISEDRGVPYVAMEFLEGEPLDVRLKRGPKLTADEILRIGRETALGLAAAHERGLIHRDIKPGNLWLEAKRGRVKILDFGLARAMSDETHLTQTGAIIGTPAYMAPEQAGGRAVDHRCDLFSLGCVLYRLCTGEMAFKGNDTLAIISALALETPPPPREIDPGVPQPLSDLVMHLLAKKPEERPQSAKVVVETLQEIESAVGDKPPKTASAKKKGATTRTESAPTQQYRPAKKRPAMPLLIAGGVLGVGVVGLLLFLLLRPRDNQESRAKGGSFESKQETLPPTFKNSLGMEFVLIPAGKFTMGSSPEEIDRCLKLNFERVTKDCVKSQGPEHEVEITQPFYLGVHEVTVGQFRQFVTENKYQVGDDRWLKPEFEQADDHPVVWVSWNNAVDFCAWLSKKEGLTYRLPTEAEWEYSCRTGTNTAYSFGDQDAELMRYAWINTNSQARTHPVGSLRRNAWGLFDMNGNVWEWCQDGYDPNYYKSSPTKDPSGAADAGQRVIRGGSWFDGPAFCRSAFRHSFDSEKRIFSIGFRVVLTSSSPVGNEPVVSPPLPPPEKKSETLPPAFKNSIGMKFTLIPAGKFTMGSTPGEVERCIGLAKDRAAEISAEAPEHEVEITRPFYMGVHEVTVGQFRRFVTEAKFQVDDPRWLNPGFEQTDDHPVVWVTWQNAVDFCAWMSNQEGRKYRLPTEAEWEYSCRAGKAGTRFGFGNEDADLGLHAWYAANAGGKTHPVGKLKENAWGLFDMHGNAWEWCQDYYDPLYYKTSPKQNPSGPIAGGERVTRGGSWLMGNDPVLCRCAFRNHHGGGCSPHLGFRVVCESPPKAVPIPAGKTLTNNLGMEFVLVPKGKAWLGGGNGNPGTKEVEITNDFYLGMYEVTQEEWEKVMGSNPSGFSRLGVAKDAVKDISDADLKRFPVEMVSWNDAQLFLGQLNKRDKQEGWVYRLPKEVEWEYACRGGAMSDRRDSAFDFYFDKPTNQLLPGDANFAPQT